jgi:ParB family chromosome partitioning protein
VRAAELAGYVDVPVIIKTNLSDAEAKLFVTETNLMQRAFSDLSHSEKALSLAQHYEMLKRQGKQKDVLNEIESLLTPNDSGVQIEHLKSRDKMGSEYGLSATNVTRYIRISKLNSGLLEQLDNGKLGFNPAYQISFIEDSILQIQIAELIQNGSKVDLKKSEQLRKYFANGNLTNKMVARILSNNDSPKSKSFKIRAEIIERFFEDDLPDCEIEGIIVTALQFYNDNRQDVVNNDDSDYDDDSEYGDD